MTSPAVGGEFAKHIVSRGATYLEFIEINVISMIKKPKSLDYISIMLLA